MKKAGLYLFVFLCIVIIADADDSNAEHILIARGYTKFRVGELFIPDVYADTYKELFNADYYCTDTTRITITLTIPHEFTYRLYYVYERKDLPNILTVVFIDTEEGSFGFYKKNLSLTGVKVQTVTDLARTWFEKDQLVFY